MLDADQSVAPIEAIPLGFMPRYQIGREIPFPLIGPRIFWRDVNRYRFFDAMISRGILSPKSDIEATTILHAAGAVTRDGRVLFRVLKY